MYSVWCCLCTVLMKGVWGYQEMVGAMSAEMVGEEDLWGVDEEGRSRTQTPEREEGREGGDDRGRAHGRERLEHAEARALQVVLPVIVLRLSAPYNAHLDFDAWVCADEAPAPLETLTWITSGGGRGG